MPLPVGIFRPVSSGVFCPEYGEYGTNDVWRGTVIAFPDTSVREEAHGFIPIPTEFLSTPASVTLTLHWTTVQTSGNCLWDLDYRLVGGTDTESLDQTGVQEALTVTTTAPTVAHRRRTSLMTATASNFNSGAGKTLEIKIARDGVNETSSIAGPVLFFGGIMEWS